MAFFRSGIRASSLNRSMADVVASSLKYYVGSVNTTNTSDGSPITAIAFCDHSGIW
jgi:hypothetical protein